MSKSIKFGRYAVSNGETKARVSYHLDNRRDGRSCVTLYAQDYGHALGRVLGDVYENGTDLHTDYFDKGSATLFADHPLYAAARAAAEVAIAKRETAWKQTQERRMERARVLEAARQAEWARLRALAAARRAELTA